MAELIVKSKVREVVKGMNVSSDVPEALNRMAEELVKRAAQRADANGRKTIQAKDAFVGKRSAKTMLVVRSKVKEIAKKHNVSGDFAEALNEMIVWSVGQAAERAKENGRRTVQARDI